MQSMGIFAGLSSDLVIPLFPSAQDRRRVMTDRPKSRIYQSSHGKHCRNHANRSCPLGETMLHFFNCLHSRTRMWAPIQVQRLR